MYEYKVETYKVKVAENEMNKLASEGWRVIAVTPNEARFEIVVTYERKKDWYKSKYIEIECRIYEKIFKLEIVDVVIKEREVSALKTIVMGEIVWINM